MFTTGRNLVASLVVLTMATSIDSVLSCQIKRGCQSFSKVLQMLLTFNSNCMNSRIESAIDRIGRSVAIDSSTQSSDGPNSFDACFRDRPISLPKMLPAYPLKQASSIPTTRPSFGEQEARVP